MSEERTSLVLKVAAARAQLERAKDDLQAFDLRTLALTTVAIPAGRVYKRRSDVWECKICGRFAVELDQLDHAADCPLLNLKEAW